MKDSGTIKVRQEEPTPVTPPWAEMRAEIRDIKVYCQRICDQSLAFQERIPALEKRVDRLALFQAWFPTAAALAALIWLAVR